MSAASEIKRIRHLLVLQQKEFAEQLRITRAAISNYESGKRMPTMPIIRKIIELAKKNKVKVNLEEFFNDLS